VDVKFITEPAPDDVLAFLNFLICFSRVMVVVYKTA
jgi:hypothetical protein